MVEEAEVTSPEPRDINLNPLNCLNWVFKKRIESSQYLVKIIGQLLELLRKFLLEGQLQNAKVLLKAYYEKHVQQHQLVVALKSKGAMVKQLDQQSFDFAEIGKKFLLTEVQVQVLVIHLRELERAKEFLSLRDMYQDFYQSYLGQDESTIIVPDKYIEDLNSLESRCLKLFACQPVKGHVHQILFSDPSDTPAHALDSLTYLLHPVRQLQLQYLNSMYAYFLLQAYFEVKRRMARMSELLKQQGKQFPVKAAACIQVHCFLAGVDQYAKSMVTKQPFANDLISSLMGKEARQEVVGKWQVDGILTNARIMAEILVSGEIQSGASDPSDEAWNTIWNDSDIIL